ncbi:MAG: nucleotide-binding protein [Motilibacteraceae bacterium]
MNKSLVELLRGLRRRWIVPVVAGLLAAGIAWVTSPAPTPSSQTPVASPGVTYRATATYVADQQNSALPNLNLLQTFVTAGDIPQRAAKALGQPGQGPLLAARVTASGDPKLGTFAISATDEQPAQAEKIATAFGDATIASLAAQVSARQDQQVKNLTDSVKRLATTIQQTRVKASTASGIDQDLLTAQANALQDQYTALIRQLAAVQSQSPGDVGLTLLQAPVAVPISSGGTVAAITSPHSRPLKTVAGLLLGLALGAGAVLLLERLDSRPRTRAATTAAFGLPVVAEVPLAGPRERRDFAVLVDSAPESAVAEAYRGLRATLVLLPTSGPGSRYDDASRRQVDRDGRGFVVLVTSPGPGAGKTSTIANLAAAFAETGKRVLVLDFDLRNPQAHLFLDVPDARGLSDLAGTGRVRDLDGYVRPTSLRGVELITAGSEDWAPGVVTAAMGDIIEAASHRADVVLVDSPPLLSGSDAIDVLPYADTTVLLSAAGRTNPGEAQRAGELLERLNAEVLGVVIVGSETPAVRPSGTPGRRWHPSLPGRRSAGRSRRRPGPAHEDVERVGG